MPGGWKGSDRRERLPADWPTRRAFVLERDGYRCTHIRADTGTRCPDPATDADHIEAGDDHSYANLAAKCDYHHKHKTAREGNAARALSQAQRRELERRPVRKHPGLL